MIRVGTVIATLGSVALVLSLFIVPWFFVREITVIQPSPGQANTSSIGNTGNTGNVSNTSSQPSINSFAPRLVQRDLHDFGIVGWASTRRQKRDGAIVVLALLTQAAVLVGSISYRWRLFLMLAGVGALGAITLTLIDYLHLTDLIRGRVAVATAPTSTIVVNTNVLKIAGALPGTGMVVLLAGSGVVLFGVLLALFGGRRGKVLVPVVQ